MMINDKQEIKDFAKELYCKYDAEGRKVYSLRDIENEILHKFDKKFTFQTVKNWAKKHDWDKTNEKIKQQSIIKAQDDKFSTDEKIIEAESDSLAKDYHNANELSNAGFKIFLDAAKFDKEHKVINIKDALTAIKLGTDIKFRIAGLPEKNEDNKTPDLTGLTYEQLKDLTRDNK